MYMCSSSLTSSVHVVPYLSCYLVHLHVFKGGMKERSKQHVHELPSHLSFKNMYIYFVHVVALCLTSCMYAVCTQFYV